MTIQSIIAKAISPDKKPPMDPNSTNYTVPKTYGVYEINAISALGKRYRFGNHPVRLRELENEFGKATCIALFYVRELTQELAQLYNTNKPCVNPPTLGS